MLLSTNAINDEDGNRIRATYAKKEEVGGIYEAIEATNTTVASHTQSIESLELNKQDNLDFGNGLSTVGNLVKVEDAVLKDIADNKKNIDTLSSSISVKQDKLTASDGINLEDGKLSVHIGTGLDFDPESSAVVVKVGAGIKTDINQALTIKHDTTLTTDADGQLGVNQGTITDIAASEVAKVVANAPANYDTLKEIADYIATDAEGAAQLSNRIGALESELPNKMDAVAFGSGLAFSSNVVKVADTVMADIANNKSNIGKLQSSVDGLSTSKQDTISDLETIRNNASNGATAYGWGNHGIAGYAKKAKVNGHVYEADADTIINLPAYPTSLPANGGNADTLDGHDSSYFATASALDNKQDALTFGSGLSETNGTLKVDVSELASSNLDVTNDGRLTVGTNTIKNIAGNGLKANNQQLDLDTSAFAKVATSGSYNDLSNKPTIPSAVTESTVSGWGFTKNTGTYSKPSGGIPKSDLASSVQTSLNNADTAYGWGDHHTGGYAKKVKVGDKTYEADAGAVVSLPAYPTSLPASGGNADTLGGLPLNTGTNKPWNTIPAVNHGGYMDIGRHLEFHYDNETGSDYSTILMCQGNYNNLVLLPSRAGTLALTNEVADAGAYDSATFDSFSDKSFIGSIYPSGGGYPSSSLQWFNVIQIAHRNGVSDGAGYVSQIALGMTGNEDKMWFRGSRNLEWNEVISSANIGYQNVKYASIAGNSDTLDGHDSTYFATKNELGNKQDTLAFGNGLQFSNNVVQLKLSTGLAIDDRGYLYVTGL